MPIFQYKAFASGGGTVAGVVDADTVKDARSKLRRQNVLVSEISELEGRGKRVRRKRGNPLGGWLMALREHRAAQATPSGRDLEVLAGVTRQMATLLGSGIPLAETLTAIVEQAEQR
ncbi:MAG: hypothetical protein QF724_11310, partial [Planctomycetota bacterium]|nr:hypothetical protein [Planctomycetota bacterium]